MSTPRTFTTTDFSLVVTLATLGVPMVNHEGGIAVKGDCPEWREFDASVLDEKGWTVDQAIKAGYEGEIAYGFADHPSRKTIIDAFRKAASEPSSQMEIPDVMELKDSDGNVVEIPMIEVLAAACAMYARNRKYFAGRRKKVTPRLRIRTNDGHVVVSGNASEATKKHFGV